MKKNQKSIRTLDAKQLDKNETKMIVGGTEPEVTIQTIDFSIESWTLDYT